MTYGDIIRQNSNEELAEKFTLIGMGHTPTYDVIPYNPIDKTADYWSWLRYLNQEAPTPQKKVPLCDDCKHAIDGVVDDFAAAFCAVRCGYFGQVKECEKYERKQTE